MISRLRLLLGTLLILPLALSCSAPAPQPQVVAPTATPVPRPPYYAIAEAYLKAWQEGRYSDMYDLLSAASQATISRDRFVQRYSAITEGATIVSVKASVTTDGKLVGADTTADVPFEVVMGTSRLGAIREQNVLPVARDGDRWRVNWSPSLIFRDLTGDSRILFEPEEPRRGSILDRRGRPLAETGKVATVGVIPGQVTDEAAMLAALEREAKISPEQAKRALRGAQPDWFVPLKDLQVSQAAGIKAKLDKVPGIVVRDKTARVYPAGSAAAHVVGFMTRVTADELKKLAPKGYGEEDFVGRSGIEAWAEDTLAGERGGKLSVVSAQGSPIKTIAHKPAADGQDVQLTIDLDLQKLAEASLGQQAGSAVLIDTRDNSILVLASYPRFDPNLFVTGISDADWRKLDEDPLRPFQNRPLMSSYPTGSVFKVVTMAAGMDKGGFTGDSQFECNGKWDGLGTGQVLGDWLPQGHGRLNLVQGLEQSCNIVFYELGKKLDSIDPKLLPQAARGFGFGQPTGVVGLQEAPGLVPDPAWKKGRGDSWYLGDSVNLAIGQGFFLATPLQVANAYAAIARGGTLQTPVLASKRGGQVLQTQSKGSLPVAPATLETIRRAMRGVTSDPKGTAYYAFSGSKLSVAAKTGTAEAGGPDSHAWFAAFAPAEQPQIAMVVMVEEKGHGAEVAAPVARRILDGYLR